MVVGALTLINGIRDSGWLYRILGNLLLAQPLTWAALVPVVLISGMVVFALPDTYGGVGVRLLRTAGLAGGSAIVMALLFAAVPLLMHPGGDSWGLFGIVLSLMVYTAQLMLPVALGIGLTILALRPSKR